MTLRYKDAMSVEARKFQELSSNNRLLSQRPGFRNNLSRQLERRPGRRKMPVPLLMTKSLWVPILLEA